MAETMGSLIDKICIAELKLYHIQEQMDRNDLAQDLRDVSRERLAIMKAQRDDLVSELSQLGVSWSRGTWRPTVYRQFKLYNDPRFQKPHPHPSRIDAGLGRYRKLRKPRSPTRTGRTSIG